MSLLKELRKFQDAPQILDFEIDNDPVFHIPPKSLNVTDHAGEDRDENQWFWDELKPIAAAQSGIDAKQLGEMILNSLKEESSESVQMTLVEMLGFDHLDFVAQIISNRPALLAPKKRPGLSKEEQAEWKRQNRIKAAEQAANLAWQDMIDPQYPHVYRQQKQKTALELVNVKRVLPEGTTRESFPGFEHVVIPAQKQNTQFHPKQLLNISDLDDICQVTFSKYQTLNKMQTLVYPVCYETNENMLICAPTGAGKTDVALLSCLSTINAVRKSGDVANNAWKIVYVAPLKALAAEITDKLGTRLAWMGIKVRELTGDMQLTRQEIASTHILVTTPEKWDVVTRKPNDDSGLATQLRLLIIDEVHLLHEERGAVLESIVARTRRQVEAQQRAIRIIGLSATLPNFVDVDEFLGVNPQQGLFYFDQSFRPVPLEQQFYGVRAPHNNPHALAKNIDRVAYDECVRQLRKGHSVMIFVHSRRDTVKTAQSFMNMAQQDGLTQLFLGESAENFTKEMRQFSHRGMQELFQAGFATHHAGMARNERNMSEKLFANGGVRVLCCTATLAWGVNLPAAVVIIKGTQVYDAQKGGFVDLGISDVIQIFGRAGRPQFEQTGTGILCTGADKLDHYLDAITNQYPIESKFAGKLPEHLNAEIALGSVSTVGEAIRWLGYTYMHVRMRKSPQTYGLLPRDLESDPHLLVERRKMVLNAARLLRETQMIILDENDAGESLIAKDIGRIASEYYLLRSTVEQFNNMMGPSATEQQFVDLMSKGEDFSGLKIRSEEVAELDRMLAQVPFDTDLSSPNGKSSVLLQAWISQVNTTETALNSDMAYVAQNSARIIRAFFLLCISRGWSEAAYSALLLDRSLLQRTWPMKQHALLQMADSMPPASVERKLTSSRLKIEDLKQYSSKELGDLVHNHGWGPRIAGFVNKFPLPTILVADARPITSRVVQVHIETQLLRPFRFDYKLHGGVLHFWMFVYSHETLLHTEKMMITSQNAGDIQKFEFPVPYSGSSVIVRIVSDAYLDAETMASLDFSRLKLPTTVNLRTNLLNLRPLSVHAWKNAELEKHYSRRFKHFNPMQTMVFHSLYYGKDSVLLGSPTGSGKTIACEVAIWAALRDRPDAKVVYIAPMKALVRERVGDWKSGITNVPFLPGRKKPKLVEMTGDTQPTAEEVKDASLIITTPEKFDGVSRNYEWATQNVSLVIMDEVHLLASDRGAILEVIVSRMNRSKSDKRARLLGMSTAVANAGDLASWLGVKTNGGVFNFPSSVRPVPLEMYIDGFPDVQGGFCPLMKSMNKPAYLSIKRHSPEKPVIVFVASRRQTRLTAMDLIGLRAGDDDQGTEWLKISEQELEPILAKVKDDTLKHTLQFGIAIHHAGLEISDRQISHELYASGKVQVLVATSTLAWGVNLPAYLVIVKGTQFFDAKINKYRDMDLTDVLQMMGRAGRPAYDTSGVATVFTKQRTKQYYKYFLNLGFPVESSLHKAQVLENHLGAEISSGRVKSINDALDFISHTFLYRRVHSNYSYYTKPDELEIVDGEETSEGETVSGDEGSSDSDSDIQMMQDTTEKDEILGNKWLVQRVRTAFDELYASQCLFAASTETSLSATPYLSITSFYYISHLTTRMFLERIMEAHGPKEVLQCIALSAEYDDLAIRHNEDLLNTEISKKILYPGEELGIRMVDPHVKAYVLIQARMSRVELPVEDYIPDTITVLDQALRIFQALIDTASYAGLFGLVVNAIKTLRSVKQAVNVGESMIKNLPGVKANNRAKNMKLQDIKPEDSSKLGVAARQRDAFAKAVSNLPRVEIDDATAIFRPSKQPVLAPMFHRPQRESWFVIIKEGEKVVSLERIQRPKKVTAPPNQEMVIMNDTVDIDYVVSG